jgi:hypothetical protein
MLILADIINPDTNIQATASDNALPSTIYRSKLVHLATLHTYEIIANPTVSNIRNKTSIHITVHRSTSISVLQLSVCNLFLNQRSQVISEVIYYQFVSNESA